MKNNEEEAEEQQAAKKTRELPNLSECHSCHLRVDIANPNPKSKLQILYSEWRIVLLCKKCFSRVESSELCSYCFSTSSSRESFSCRQCNRRVHRHCDSENRSAALWSGSRLAMAVSVCADCWVPESLAKWRGVVSSRKARRNGKNRVGLGLGKSRVSPNLSVCVCDSSTEVCCLKLEIVEESGNDDGPLKEGEGSCSNGADVESSPALCKQEQEEQRCKGKLDPFYFKYRKRSKTVCSLLTYKRRKPENHSACVMLTYKRRPKNVHACSMLTYQRRRT